MAKKIVVDFEFKGIEGVEQKVGDVVEQTRSLKQQFREALREASELAGADIVDEAKLQEAIARTAELKDRMNDVNEQIAVLTAGSKFEILSNNLGDIGGKIASLDFEGANESALKLIQLSKTITFAEAGKGIKDLTSTFANLGRALLTNPLFLLAGAIIGIITVIGKALDKLGLLKKITEAVGYVFDLLVDAATKAISAITDFFGITSEEERKLAAAMEATADKAAKASDAFSKKSEEVIQGIDGEIERARIQGKDTEALERKRMALITERARLQADADKKTFEAALKKVI